MSFKKGFIIILISSFSAMHCNAQNSIDYEILKYELGLKKSKVKNDSNTKIYYLIKLGELNQFNGNLYDAEKYLIEAVSISRDKLLTNDFKLFPKSISEQLTIFDSFDQLAQLYIFVGNYRNAEKLLNESKFYRNKYLNRKSVHRIKPLCYLGTLYYKTGRYDSAYFSLKLADSLIRISTSTGYDFDNLTRIYLYDLAEVSLNRKNFNDAKKYIERLAIASTGIGKYNSKNLKNYEYSKVFELYARYYFKLGNINQSIYYLKKASAFLPKNSMTSTLELKILKLNSCIHWFNKDYTNASFLFNTLIDAYYKYIEQSFKGMNEYEKIQFYRTMKIDFEYFYNFVFDAPESLQNSLFPKAMELTVKTKGLVINKLNNLKDRVYQKGDSILINDFKKLELTKSVLASLYFLKNKEVEIDSIMYKIGLLEDKINTALSLPNKILPNYNYYSILNSLKNDETVVHVFRINLIELQSLYISNRVTYKFLIINKLSDSIKCVTLENGNDLDKRAYKFYINSLKAAILDTVSYNNYWLNVIEKISKDNKIYFIADGVYNKVNLNTLFNKTSKKFVLQESNVTYLSDLNSLIREENVKSSNVVSLFGNPNFDFNSTHSTVNKDNNLRYIQNEDLLELKSNDFSSLPGSEIEIEKVDEILNKKNFIINKFKSTDATEENIKLQDSPYYLHIASHGFFINDTLDIISPMIRSGVILAGVRNKVQGVDDGILTALEASDLKLDNTQMVVLSACQTGIGDYIIGEGVYGLRRAFFIAGARNLVMSLWKIDDSATEKLISTFYQFLSSSHDNSITWALRNAQLDLLENSKFNQPFYWGGFINVEK